MSELTPDEVSVSSAAFYVFSSLLIDIHVDLRNTDVKCEMMYSSFTTIALLQYE